MQAEDEGGAPAIETENTTEMAENGNANESDDDEDEEDDDEDDNVVAPMKQQVITVKPRAVQRTLEDELFEAEFSKLMKEVFFFNLWGTTSMCKCLLLVTLRQKSNIYIQTLDHAGRSNLTGAAAAGDNMNVPLNVLKKTQLTDEPKSENMVQLSLLKRGTKVSFIGWGKP